ncbi:MAG: tetratricopeptide repeat protein, partial [Bacteroidota bacterium]
IKSIEKGQNGVALKLLKDAHYLDPSNNDALYWLGFLLKRLNRLEEGAEALSLVSERVPGMAEVEAALVDTFIAMDEPEGAVYHAQRLLDVAPYEPTTLLKLADAYEANGKPDLAIDALNRAPLHKPTLTDTLVDIHYRLGLLHESEGNTAQARDHFERVCARDISYKDIRTRIQQFEPDSPSEATDA